MSEPPRNVQDDLTDSPAPESPPVRLPPPRRALGLRRAYKRVRQVAYAAAGLGMILAFAGRLLPATAQPMVVPTGFALILLGFILLLVGYGLFIAIKLKESP